MNLDRRMVDGLNVTAREYGLDVTKWMDLALLTLYLPYIPDEAVRFPLGKHNTILVLQRELDAHASEVVKRVTFNKEKKDIVKE